MIDSQNKSHSLRRWRRTAASAAAAGLLATTATPAQAAPRHPAPARTGLTSLVGLSAERILLADKVAAAKFGTSTPIEDPVREQQVLDQAAALAAEAGVDAGDAVEFFRAQIEVSKVVQRGLHDLWTKHPELAPTERPDLATEVRPQLDRITVSFIEQLAATTDLRGPNLRCFVSLLGAEATAGTRYHLDSLHERALRGAVQPICEA
ncbi:gamma subclass chorismate mutase AroQ [Actinoplanes sp. RD1]|uniref:gamma subclass chorismate mutase AroQ n=1 Tax=Actinoplanes sp. RD1 TaxID=3064538 RepID=UPI0027414634|nr:gamma subclass chorismate mutase AroQ [Actinoplanes sp. RD1]